MIVVRHTFLFDEAAWTGRGTFTDAAGTARVIEGSADIVHHGDHWTNHSVIRLLTDPPVEFTNDYRIVPFAAGAPATNWESENPGIGRMSGNFAIVGDSILSTFASESGTHNGAESLQMIESDRYLGRGVVYRYGRFFSAWIVELRRRPAGAPGKTP
jgi:hypothetical protein